MEEKDFLKKYCEFADFTMSDVGKNDDMFIERVKELSSHLNGNFSRLDAAMIGLAGETGETVDLWKKIKFHKKSFDDNKEKLIEELGDIFWYLAQASIALDVPMDEIITRNIAKLKARHPNGFSEEYMKK